MDVISRGKQTLGLTSTHSVVESLSIYCTAQCAGSKQERSETHDDGQG